MQLVTHRLMRSTRNLDGKDFWVVDDITDDHNYSLSLPEYFLVRLQKVNNLHTVKFLLVHKNFIESDYNYLTDDNDDDRTNKIAFGRAFCIDWHEYNLYRKRTHQTRSLNFVHEDYNSSGINRASEIEQAINKDYNEILYSIRGNKIEAISSHLPIIPIKVYVFKVGQGDTIILQFSDLTYWVIDAYFTNTDILSYFKNFIATKLAGYTFECLILSHLHYDHIKNAHALMAEYTPMNVVIGDCLKKISYTALMTLYKAKQDNVLVGLSQVIPLKSGIVKLIPTNVLNSWQKSTNPNAHGLIVTLDTDNSQMILSGDAYGDQLNDLLSTKIITPSLTKERYYKVTHHCSRTGCNLTFLRGYKPKHSVTSCGSGNRYGHPHQCIKTNIDFIAKSQKGRHKITHKEKNVVTYVIQ